MKTPLLTKTIFFLAFSIVAVSAWSQVYVNHGAAGLNDGSSWANAYTDLQDALDNPGAGDIWIAAGTYLPGSASPDTASRFFIDESISLYGGFDGTETSLAERDIAANETILSGDLSGDDVDEDFDINRSDNVVHVVYIDSLISAPVTLDGLTIQGGVTEGDNTQDSYFWRGGGVYSLSAIHVRNCEFNNNFARSGGSIYLGGSNADGSIIESSTFLRNRATSQSAGPFINLVTDARVEGCTFGDNVVNRGALYFLRCTNPVVRDCEFLNNVNPTGFGGACYNWNSVNMEVIGCIFFQNSAGNAGAMYVDGRELSVPNMHIDSCTFEGNSAGTGGAVYFSRSIYTVNETVFKDNTATWGGGTANYTDSQGDYTNCTFQTNTSNNGGGGTTMGFESTMTYTDCQFLENTGGWGAGMFSQNDSTSVVVMDCQFTQNTAPGGNGGGFYGISGGNWSFENVVFEANTAEVGAAISVIEDSLDIATLQLSNIEFTFNTAELQGGAISNSNADITASNCLFNTNIANVDDNNEGGIGGAISNNASQSTFSDTVIAPIATIDIINSTFAGNRGMLAAGIAQWEENETAEASVTLQNCIFANEGLNYAIELGEPEVTSNGGNLSTDDTMNDYLTGTNDLTETDPLFLDGAAFDFHLSENSPCIDKGISTGAPTLDLDGNPREGEVDMGAYEYQMDVGFPAIPTEPANIQLSPNPANDVVQVTMENIWRGTIHLQLFNSLGQLVLHTSFDKNADEAQEELAIGHLQPGFYQLVLHDATTSHAATFIKQ